MLLLFVGLYGIYWVIENFLWTDVLVPEDVLQEMKEGGNYDL